MCGIEPEVSGELVVQPNEAGRGDGGGRQARKEPLRQPRVAVVERKDVRCFGWCEHFISGARRPGQARSPRSTIAGDAGIEMG